MAEQKNNVLGNKGESIAIETLRAKGYKIVHVNWRYGKNEIDIIAEIENTTVFVEVKSRLTDNAGHPEQAVGKSKMASIKKVALEYIETNIVDKIRFDIIAITFWPDAPMELIHFEDAFF